MDIVNSIVKRGKLTKIKRMIDIITLLQALGIKTKQGKQYNEEFYDLCPHPEHNQSSPKWSINTNPESEKFGTHNCFTCGFKGNFITLTAIKLTQSTGKQVSNEQALEFIVNLFSIGMLDENSIYDLMLEERKNIHEHKEEKGPLESKLPDEFIKFKKDMDNQYYSYLTKPISEGGRGLNWALLNKYKIGYCAEGLYKSRIVIPFMQKGILISFIARSILPTMQSKKKEGIEYLICPECNKMNRFGIKECIKCDHRMDRYVTKQLRARYPKGSTMEYMLWPYDSLDIELDYVILVEGAMDKLRLESLGYKNVLCLFGNKISDFQVELLKEHEQNIGKKLRIFLFPDADEGGNVLIEFANQKIKYLFQVWVVELPWIPESWLDPGSASIKQIRTAFNKAEKLHIVYRRKFS